MSTPDINKRSTGTQTLPHTNIHTHTHMRHAHTHINYDFKNLKSSPQNYLEFCVCEHLLLINLNTLLLTTAQARGGRDWQGIQLTCNEREREGEERKRKCVKQEAEKLNFII